MVWEGDFGGSEGRYHLALLKCLHLWAHWSVHKHQGAEVRLGRKAQEGVCGKLWFLCSYYSELSAKLHSGAQGHSWAERSGCRVEESVDK